MTDSPALSSLHPRELPEEERRERMRELGRLSSEARARKRSETGNGAGTKGEGQGDAKNRLVVWLEDIAQGKASDTAKVQAIRLLHEFGGMGDTEPTTLPELEALTPQQRRTLLHKLYPRHIAPALPTCLEAAPIQGSVPAPFLVQEGQPTE